METGDETGDDREVSCSGACVGESLFDPLGGDHSTAPWQRTGAVVKEVLYIQMTPSEECFNRDGGLEVPSCWTTVMRTCEEAGREE